ncbi:MAG: hypothetical protein WCP21_07360, partial [Armatimonadota bacterium]
MNRFRADRCCLGYRRLVAVTLLCLVGSFASAQTITSFENAQELAIVSPSGLQAAQSSAHATDGQYSLRVEVKGSEKDTWPGLIYTPADPDLSGKAVLAYDVFLEGDAPVTLSCRVDDAAGKSVFLSSTANPGKNTIELWLVSHKFEVDLKHLTRVYP